MFQYVSLIPPFQPRVSQLRNDLESIRQVVSPPALLGDYKAPGSPRWKLVPALSRHKGDPVRAECQESGIFLRLHMSRTQRTIYNITLTEDWNAGVRLHM